MIIRPEDTSHYPNWLGPANIGSWDLIVSYFREDSDPYKGPDVMRIGAVGPKWPALGAMFQKRPELLDGYDGIWLPDDDLAIGQVEINEVFATCERFDLEVAQPSLAWTSCFCHVTTL